MNESKFHQSGLGGTIERKSLPDLLDCIGQDRERFDPEVIPLPTYPVWAIVVAATSAEIKAGDFEGRPRNSQIDLWRGNVGQHFGESRRTRISTCRAIEWASIELFRRTFRT